jgi:two-component system, LytTR family, sensor kinase
VGVGQAAFVLYIPLSNIVCPYFIESMPTVRYFGVTHLWRFCLIVCLTVNLPQLLTYLWNPGYFNNLAGYSAIIILFQFTTSLVFGGFFAYLHADTTHAVVQWYQRLGPLGRWGFQLVYLITFTELFFWLQLLLTGPVSLPSYFHVTYLVRHLVVMVAIRGFWYFVSIIHRSNQVAIENEQLKRLKVKNQLEALSNQLNPHFLFNALNILNVSITTNPEVAQGIVHNLSDILRYNLKIQNQNLVRLAEELEVAHSYLGLYKARFGEKLVFSFENDKPTKSWYVVPLSLQILIENAIKHNVITSNHILHISVSINEELGQLTVVNSINKKTQTESLGIGLTNLGKRYQLITGRHTASAEDSQQFTVTIPLIESP